MKYDLEECHDCGVGPGEVHERGCDTERCSVCGIQFIQCYHPGHDPGFARWTGLFPGEAEALALGIGLNTFMEKELYKIFFIRPY
jgi:hypothetical protein